VPAARLTSTTTGLSASPETTSEICTWVYFSTAANCEEAKRTLGWAAASPVEIVNQQARAIRPIAPVRRRATWPDSERTRMCIMAIPL
jgi:hypothetical protein